MNRDRISKMTVVQLKARLKKLGLPVSGNKAILVDRLLDYYQREELDEFATTWTAEDWQAIDRLLERGFLSSSPQGNTIFFPNSSNPEGAERQDSFADSPAAFGFSSIKGLDQLIEWAKMTGQLFKPEARQFGFNRYPTGVLLTGVPGCGKTMVAKAIAEEWGINFIRKFPDQLVGSCISDNERFMRELLDEAKASAPTVVFIDEAEKFLGQTRAGSHYRASDAARDSAESILLQFMEEDNSGVFFVFTANDYDKLSPPLIDRFDERFFIDLPDDEARNQIIQSMLQERGRNPSKYEIENLIPISKKFTGRDIRSAIDEAMKKAFCDGMRDVTMDDLEDAFTNVCPTTAAHGQQIGRMRAQVLAGRIRSASTEKKKSQQAKGSGDSFIGWH